MRSFACLALLALPLSAQAQEVSSIVSGNFAGPANDGYFYDAEIYRASENLVLTIWESMSANRDFEQIIANPAFEMTPLNNDGLSTLGREWLEATPDGPLVFRVLSDNDGYLYSREITLSHIDNMIMVTGYAEFTNRLADRNVQPEKPFSCFSEGCFSCTADLMIGVGAVGDEVTSFDIAYEDRNAALWNPDRARELGICPAYD